MTTHAQTLNQTLDLGTTETATTAIAPVRRAVAALTSTKGDVTHTLVRLALGGVLLPHGLQKAFGLFGGYGFEGTMGFLTTQIGLPWVFAALVIAIELIGATMLIVGLFSRAAALGVIAVMIGAVVTSHLSNGFFMNWSGQAAGEGFEFHLLAIGMALAVMLGGGGALSIDRWLSRTVAPQR
jgi:putative oxidoreductase